MDARIFSKIKKGDIIPAFTLNNIEGKYISSDNFLRKKNLVIFLFNHLQSGCCPQYLYMLNDIYDKLKNFDTEILAISQDKLETLKRFAEEKKIKFNFLLDSYKKVIDKFTYKDRDGNNVCALFITDKFQSLYQPYFHEPFGKLPDKDEIISSIEFLEKQCPECGVSSWPENLG